ncbi:MAG: FliM/FliN family flagellar motor switch protein, partial [Pseudomonadota bacterium]|nr:FliM/FliN family flagellar motor switch protein [Pseudomonadota bacterium]
SEVVVVSRFHIELEGGGGDFQVTMPYSMLEPIRELLDAGVQSDVSERDERWAHALREDIKSAEISLSATLTEARMSLADVVKLRAGDVIPIEMPELVTVRAEDVPVFRGKYGLHDNNMAIKIVEQVERTKENPLLMTALTESK